MSRAGRPLVWLRGEVKTPPFSAAARIETGSLLRRLQEGEALGPPHSRPMPMIGPQAMSFGLQMVTMRRLIYHVDTDAVVILDVFSKKTQTTTRGTIETCRARLKKYRRASGSKG